MAAAAVLTYQNSNAANFLWSATNGISTTINWSDPANWSPTGVPGITDTAIFGAGGTVGDALTVNNVVDTSTTVSTLNYTNATSGAWHVTQISAPNKLTVTNSLTVGGLNADGSVTSVGMIGNGTLEVDGPTFKVGNAGSSSSSTINGTLDLSGLSNFVYNAAAGSWIVAGSGGDARGAGVLDLAGYSNNITVGTINFNTGSGNNSGFHSLIQLGNGTNIFNVNSFVVCQTKAQFATIQFQPGAPAEAGLRIRGTNGATDDTSRATITLGDRNNTGGAGTDGEMLLNSHPVDIKAATLTIGQDRSGSSGTSTHFGTGVLQFDTGVVDATGINLALCTSGNTASSATGTLTVGANGKLIAGTNGIIVGRLTSATAATANLNIFGTAFSSNSIVKGTTSATANIDLTGGKLTMVSGVVGTPDMPINNLTLASSTLTLPADGGVTNVVVSNFNPADSANVINISALPILTGYPTFLPLISYSALANSGDISLGTMPGTFKGYITNDTTAAMVFLVITNGPATSKTDTWTGNASGTWDTSSLNWTSSSAPAAYAENDSVVFDDSSTRTNITLSAARTPLSMLFNNGFVAYTFSGTGKISGETGLTNASSGSVALKSTGGDNFSGGIVVNAGTVILDDANSAITGPLTIAGGATVQIGNNDANGNILSSIANDGSLIINRADNLGVNTSISGFGSLTQLGNGTLSLSNANTYFGDTIVSKGTLALAGSGSITNSGNVNVTSATLDLSGVASGTTVLNTLNLNNATLKLANTNGFTPLTVINSIQMAGTASTINVTALPGMASYPSTITLIQANGGIGNYNAILGTLPTGYVGSISESADQTKILLTLTSGPISTRPFALWTGNDVPNLNTNWSDAQNWQLPGAPGAGDNVIFDGNSTVGDALTVDNIVDANTTISTLRYTNSVNGQWHVTGIPAGVTLTVNSNLTVGGQTIDGAVSLAAMNGGGTLVVGGTSLTIGNNSSGPLASGTTLDLSGLSNFVYNVPTGIIGLGTGVHSVAAMKLANGSNYITAATLNDNTTSTSSSGTGNLTLGGGTNIINVGAFNIAAGRGSSTVSFPDVTGGLRVRGVGGTDSDRAAVTIGNRNNSGGSGNTLNGSLSVNGHPVDMKLSTLTLGQSGSNPTGTANGNGTLSFDTGTVDVNGIVMAVANGSSIGVQATGTVNVGTGGTLVVGGNGISLGNKNAASGAATANLNIAGTMVSSGNVAKATAGAVGNINVTSGGTLKMLSGVIGTPAVPVDSLTIDTATLQLAIKGNKPATNIVATTVAAANVSTINIGSVVGITAPATVSLISYTGADPFPNLALGTLPAGVTATLVDNQANATIDLNITAVPAPVTTPPSISKVTISGGNINISGTNNVGGSSSFHLLTSTNLAAPLSSWTVLTNGSFDTSGSLNLSIPVNPALSRSFYLLQVP